MKAIYGADLDTWRWVLAETEALAATEVKKADTFSSKFTRKRGLETREKLWVYRARRYAAAVCNI